ncbi:class II aldolase/adducin family protein [Blastococcus sp. SYSU D00669]
MHVHQRHTPTELSDLVDLCVRLGADLRLVQGAGGNLSLKRDGVLWIKASGTRLGEAAEKEVFVPMDEAATREAVLTTEALAPYVLPEARTSGLRPSIETALHVLLPHRVVAHVHGVGTIAAGLSQDVAQAVAGLPDTVDTIVVPYAKPGIELARAVLAATQDRLDADRPVVLVLRNHGLVVGTGTSAEAGDLLDRVESALRTSGAPQLDLSGTGPLCPCGTLDEAAATVLCAGALTPDSAVFLGPAPFARIEAGPAPAVSASAGFVAADGSVWLRPDLGDDEREIAASLVDVARQVRGTAVTTLSTAQIDELINWEAEKWRRQNKR